MTSGNMTYLERKTDGPFHKLEACIWNSHSQCGTWETFKTKGTMKTLVKFRWISLGKITYSKEFNNIKSLNFHNKSPSYI